MAKTQPEIVLSTLKRRKNGFTDRELVATTGLVHAATIRAHLKKAGLVKVIGSKKDTVTGRTVKTFGLV